MVNAGHECGYAVSSLLIFNYACTMIIFLFSPLGNYEESHGIVANSMYDPVFNATFHMSTVEERWWNGAEPIWVTAKKAGRKVGMMFSIHFRLKIYVELL